MWTEEHRRTYRREGEGYPSDLRDAEWARLEPLIPKASPGGRSRKTDMRAAMNAILYLLRTGCPWRYLTIPDVAMHLICQTRLMHDRG
jgi:transposase